MLFKKPSRNELLQTIEDQKNLIRDLRREISRLKAKIAILEKDSSTSSKCPSSDIVKPPKSAKKPEGKKRKTGGQNGHEGHGSRLSPDDADRRVECESSGCPHCGSQEIQESGDKDKDFLQYELVEKPVELIDYVLKGYYCPDCGRIHNAEAPDGLEKLGIAGPRLSALVGFLKGGCHASYSVVGEFLSDVLRVNLASGTIVKIVNRVSAALSGSFNELLESLKKEAVLNVDETGFKENGGKRWIWTFRSKRFTVFKVASSRSSSELVEVLSKEYDGILSSDYFGAYLKFMRLASVNIQFCLAHLIRELKFFVKSGEHEAVEYANRLLEILREVFATYHNRGNMDEKKYHSRMQELKNEFLRIGTNSQAQGVENIIKRLTKHGENYFRFMELDGVEPTNNLAEQIIRFVVIDRKVTQGSRGEKGNRWNERIWSVRASCSQQGRSTFEFLCESISSFYAGKPTPSLLPAV